MSPLSHHVRGFHDDSKHLSSIGRINPHKHLTRGYGKAGLRGKVQLNKYTAINKRAIYSPVNITPVLYLPPVLCLLPRQQWTKLVLAPRDHVSLTDHAFGPMLTDPPHEDIAVVRVDGRKGGSSRDVEGVPPAGTHRFERQDRLEGSHPRARELHDEPDRLTRANLRSKDTREKYTRGGIILDAATIAFSIVDGPSCGRFYRTFFRLKQYCWIVTFMPKENRVTGALKMGSRCSSRKHKLLNPPRPPSPAPLRPNRCLIFYIVDSLPFSPPNGMGCR